jgi:hypothetical protein
MACQQCERLRREVTFQEREFQLALQCLDSVEETAEPGLYQKLKVRVSGARLDCEVARLMLEKHQQEGHAPEK